MNIGEERWKISQGQTLKEIIYENCCNWLKAKLVKRLRNLESPLIEKKVNPIC